MGLFSKKKEESAVDVSTLVQAYIAEREERARLETELYFADNHDTTDETANDVLDESRLIGFLKSLLGR